MAMWQNKLGEEGHRWQTAPVTIGRIATALLIGALPGQQPGAIVSGHPRFRNRTIDIRTTGRFGFDLRRTHVTRKVWVFRARRNNRTVWRDLQLCHLSVAVTGWSWWAAWCDASASGPDQIVPARMIKITDYALEAGLVIHRSGLTAPPVKCTARPGAGRRQGECWSGIHCFVHLAIDWSHGHRSILRRTTSSLLRFGDLDRALRLPWDTLPLRCTRAWPGVGSAVGESESFLSRNWLETPVDLVFTPPLVGSKGSSVRSRFAAIWLSSRPASAPHWPSAQKCGTGYASFWL